MKRSLPLFLLVMVVSACAGVPLQPTSTFAPSATPPPPSTSTPNPSATPPPPTPTLAPTPAPLTITPFVKRPSVGSSSWSPDSHWLPYVDFKAQTLHFYDALNSAVCDFPVPIYNPNPYRFLAWLTDGRVVVQTADKVLTGRPCETFVPASADEILSLDHTDPAFSPDGHYQVVVQVAEGISNGMDTLEIKDAASGKSLSKTTFIHVAYGGGNLPGSWLDSTHFLIGFTGDKGPLLLSPGKPVIQITSEIFHLPLKPGIGKWDLWEARYAVTANPSQFHLMLAGVAGTSSQVVANPLQIFHSESGQVETLPYLETQAAFSNDGHWLLVNQNPGQSAPHTLIRPIDPPGAPFEPFSEGVDVLYTWSPDGNKVLTMATKPGELSIISLYSSPKRSFLAAWQAPGYELYPSWSPDGKHLSVWGRLQEDYNQEAIFVVQVPDE